MQSNWIDKAKGKIMQNTIPQENFSKELFGLLGEAFAQYRGVFLDKGTCLFDTLAKLSAKEASTPAWNGGSTIAAQIEHVIFYTELQEQALDGQDAGDVDWDDIWNRVSGVTEAEWDDMRSRLKAVYERFVGKLRAIEDWQQNDALGIAMATLVHSAYHLGSIRMAVHAV